MKPRQLQSLLWSPFLAVAFFLGCHALPTPSPSLKPGYALPTHQITNGVTVVTYVNGVPDLAPDSLARQLYDAGARPNLTNATEWTFDFVDTAEKRAAIDAAILQGAHFKKPR